MACDSVRLRIKRDELAGTQDARLVEPRIEDLGVFVGQSKGLRGSSEENDVCEWLGVDYEEVDRRRDEGRVGTPPSRRNSDGGGFEL